MQSGASGWHMLAIEPLAAVDRGLIGEVGVFFPPDQPDGNIGWWLHPLAQRQGFATEAARALLDWCFAERGLRRVTSGCLADNEPSLRVMQRLGMRVETRSIETRRIGDLWYDEIVCAILRREWDARNGAAPKLA